MKESEVDSFNVPFYNPNEGEVREIVSNEGSFEINKIETREHRVTFKDDEEEDDDDNDYHDQSRVIKVGKKMARVARSFSEPILVAHFGDSTTFINSLFDKFAHHATQHYMKFPHQTTVNIVLSLIRK